MASFVTVRNVNPLGAVSAFLDDEKVTVEAGETVDVTPETAGKAPRWRRAELDPNGEPAEDLSVVHVRHRAGHIEVYDLGSGLLAQPDAWRLADDKSEPADPTDAGGGQRFDVLAAGGGLMAIPIGETTPEEFTPGHPGVVTTDSGTEHS